MSLPMSFAEAMLRDGLTPPVSIKPGEIARCSGLGKGPSNKAGWCWLSPDAKAGAYGCWAAAFSTTWHDERQPFTPGERALFLRRLAEAKLQAERERTERWKQASARARDIWRKAQPANPEHEYLKAKQVAPYCARQSGPRLVLPIVGWDGQLSSLQFIGPDGEKRMLTGGRKQGCFIPIHAQRGAARIVICEGFATAATLADAEPASLVLAALDAGNLQPVAVRARKHHPSAAIVIAADADAVGTSKARAAAVACAGLMAVPEFPSGVEGSDFNDLAAWQRRQA